MIKITYVSSLSKILDRKYYKLIHEASFKDMETINKPEEWLSEESRVFITKEKSFEYLHELCKDMLGGIYHIALKGEVVFEAFKVMEVDIIKGSISVLGLDEESMEWFFPASDILAYWDIKKRASGGERYPDTLIQ